MEQFTTASQSAVLVTNEETIVFNVWLHTVQCTIDSLSSRSKRRGVCRLESPSGVMLGLSLLLAFFGRAAAFLTRLRWRWRTFVGNVMCAVPFDDFVPIVFGPLVLDVVPTPDGTVALWLDEHGRVLWMCPAARA